jgi:hypothetical protein
VQAQLMSARDGRDLGNAFERPDASAAPIGNGSVPHIDTVLLFGPASRHGAKATH